MLCEIPPVLYQNRYCTQENFDVVAIGVEYDENNYDDYKNKTLKLLR